MQRTENSSSSPTSEGERLIRVRLDRIRPHPSNVNIMDEAFMAKLRENIAREDDYPPLVVRPDPVDKTCFQILDGHQRLEVLKSLGHDAAVCYVWPCDDETALRLLATLNRLQGSDDPAKRAELLSELAAFASPEELSLFLPEDAASIQRQLDMLGVDLDQLLAEFEEDGGEASDLRAMTFAVAAKDEAQIEEAVQLASSGLEGKNRRGRALARIARTYLERGER